MRSLSWLRPAGWLGMVGTMLLCGALAQAQQPEGADVQSEGEAAPAAEPQVDLLSPVEQPGLQAGPEGQPHVPLPVSEYWIGLACDASALNPAMRAQLGLPEDQGLVVMSVVPDSPAAAAGFQDHDILLSAGEKPLAGVADLVKAVDEAQEQEVSIELMRAGKKLSIKVTPVKRPEEMRDPAALHGDELLQRWIARFPGGKQRMRMAVPQPGVLMPQGFGFASAQPLPEGTTVTITKTGGEPATIVVERGEERHEVTEDKLDELPEDLRGAVGGMIGRHPFQIQVHQLQVEPPVPAPAPARSAEPQVQPAPPQQGQPAADPPAADPPATDPLFRIIERLDQLQKAVEELQAAQQPSAEPQPDEPPAEQAPQ